jgi:hypothetical protein
MHKQTVEKLTLVLEEALQKLRQAHHIALSDSDQLSLGSFHEWCARIADEIDQELIAPVNAQHVALRPHTLEEDTVCLAPEDHR